MKAVRREILKLLDGGGAHPSVRDALARLPAAKRGVRPRGLPHTAWQLLEHMRLAQRDILRYCVDPKHVSPEFPDGYWPATDAPPDARAWDKSVRAFIADLAAMRKLVRSADLVTPIAHAPDATVLEEAFLVANHNSYHTGQLVQLRRALGVWQ